MKRTLLATTVILACLVLMASSYNTIVPDCSAPGAAKGCLYPGQSGLFFNAEQPASGTRSQQFQIPFSNSQPYNALSIECIWATTPGAFEYDIQRADTDATGNYVTIVQPGTSTAITMTTAPQANGTGNFVATVDLSPWRGSYISLYVKTQTANAVNGTCKLTR